jgi:hypothetical protein
MLSAAVLLPGCALFRDDRPDPSGSPYGGASVQTPQLLSEAEAVNAAVSAISLKMAVSQQGPFRVIPKKDRTTSLGSRTIGSLTRMGLSRLQAPCPLYLEDRRNDKNEWTVILLDASGRTFYRKSFLLKGK